MLNVEAVGMGGREKSWARGGCPVNVGSADLPKVFRQDAHPEGVA